VLNRVQVPTDIVFLVVFWRLRYKLSLRDLAEMFLSLRNVHVLVEAQKRRLPALFFQVVGDPSRAPADAILSLIARRSHAGSVSGPIPGLGGVGENVTEPVEGMLNPAVRLEGARFDVQDPRVSGPDVREDQFVVNRLLVHEVLRELRTRDDGCHKSFSDTKVNNSGGNRAKHNACT